MASNDQSNVASLTNEMFTIIRAASSNSLGPRLGKLSLPGKRSIETPHYLAVTSRGVVPHLTQDNFAHHTDITGVYVGLEDCKSPPTLPPNPLLPSRRLTALLTETGFDKSSNALPHLYTTSTLQTPPPL